MNLVGAISNFANTRMGRVAKIAVPVAGLAAIAAACSDQGRDSASRGAELILKYDRNNDGKVSLDTEATYDVPRSEVVCHFPADINGDGFVMPNECAFPTSRSWIETYSIEPLVRHADADGDGAMGNEELNDVLMRYDIRGVKSEEPADGRIQNSEYDSFRRDWGERRIDARR